MITDADIKKMKDTFTTKDDLQALRNEFISKFALKNDLKRFTMKDYLKRFATKDDFKRFATKDDLKRFATKNELKTETKMLGKKIDTILIELIKFIGETKDEIMKELNDFRVEMRDITHTSRSTLDNHEVRIARLEYNS